MLFSYTERKVENKKKKNDKKKIFENDTSNKGLISKNINNLYNSTLNE